MDELNGKKRSRDSSSELLFKKRKVDENDMNQKKVVKKNKVSAIFYSFFFLSYLF